MSLELISNIVDLINIIVCLIVLTIVVWRHITVKKHSIQFLVILITIFCLLIWQIIDDVNIRPFIIGFALIALLIQVLKKTKDNIDTDNKIDESVLISQSKEQERSRIYANLHDDVGAKLLELVYSAQDDKTKTLAKEVLNNIRQAVANTVNIQCTSKQLIDEMLQESTLRLHSANINVNKKIHIVNDKQKLLANVPSVISRIMREIVSNIIKHAKADTVMFNMISDENSLILIVKDDGIGFSKTKGGKGLTTIQKRADTINSKIQWDSTPNKGTSFVLNYQYEH